MEALERRALAFYQSFLNSNDYMFYTDRNGIIQDVNEAFIRRFGYTRREAVGRSPRIVRSEHTPKELYERLWADILDPKKGYWRGRIINRTKSGDEIPVMLSITAVKDDGGDILGFVSSGVDMSEQEKLQKQLSKNEALAVIGSMAAVVAHEIRNPLGSIVTAANSIVRGGLEPQDRESLIQVLRTESKRLGETLDQFLRYTRPRELLLREHSINKTISDILSIIRQDKNLLQKVRLTDKLDKSLPRFKYDEDELRQVLWNIILNAVQAMGGKGRLRILTERDEDSAVVHVIDNGPGIPETEMGRIFQPFHTTKEQGTGLGLPLAERIVSSHGGHIFVDSELEKGTRFTIVLPLEQEPR